ncbi:glycosyltransferase [Cryobacterium sp. BB307]|uniref:glycosyltransferase n=2 Tax=unclassified Cryobacterium TaxID=2649013 RepID=UPI001445BC63
MTRDARVTKQIGWLESAGYRVDVLSRGPEAPGATGRFLRIGYPNLLVRLAIYVFLSPRARFHRLVGRRLPISDLAGHKYDLMVVNDLHLLPWVVEVASDLSKGPVTLDLHEVYSGTVSGPLFRFLHGRYDSWLLTFVPSPVFTKRLTVAEGIADYYRDRYGIPRPDVIKNVAPYQELEPSPVDPERIVLVHHGYAATARGIDVMLDAVLELEPRFVFVLMVLGNRRSLAPLRRHPAVVAGRVEFRSPVPVTEVASALNDCDLGVMFLPPRFLNNVYALPNKFFEAVQARLGIVIGESQEMVGFVRDYGLGIIVTGWEASDLAAAINRLSTEEIVAMKTAASLAASDLSTRGEGPKFLSHVGA